jgi:CBS domain-containing protein
MANGRRQQNEANGPGTEAASRGGAAVEAGARAVGEALHRAGSTGAQAAEQGGHTASEAMRRTGEAGAEAVRQTAELATEAARHGMRLPVGAQQRLVEDAADQVEEAGWRLAEAIRQGMEDARTLMPLSQVAVDGLREVQQTLAGFAEDATRSCLRTVQDLFRLASPSAVIELQQRFAREYLGALAESQASMLRAACRTADEALSPIERQIEQRRRGWQGAEPGGQRPQAGRVADVMSRDLRIASPEDTVQQAARAMREKDTGVLPVGEDDRLVGMVTDRDVALRLAAEGKDPARTKVREVMTPEVRYVFEDEDLHRAAEMMAEQQVRRLPVVNRAKRLVGVVSIGDLAAEGRTLRLAGRALAGVAREGGRHNQAAAE